MPPTYQVDMKYTLTRTDQHVDLGRLSEFYNLKARMLFVRQRFFKMHNQFLACASSYLDALPEAKTIIRLRREIRIATRGVPQTYAHEAVTSAGYVSAGTEQLYNAESHLVKAAFRMVAPLVHPDRQQGSDKLFQLVLAAYRLKDLTFLQETYINLVKDNVCWRCTDEALNYMRQEIQRPEVSLERLRTTPEFRIVMLHQQGKPEEARLFAQAMARHLVVKLQAELHFLYTQGINNPNGEANHGNQTESQDQDCADQEGGTGSNQEVQQEPFSSGEGTPGTC